MWPKISTGTIGILSLFTDSDFGIFRLLFCFSGNELFGNAPANPTWTVSESLLSSRDFSARDCDFGKKSEEEIESADFQQKNKIQRNIVMALGIYLHELKLLSVGKKV